MIESAVEYNASVEGQHQTNGSEAVEHEHAVLDHVHSQVEEGTNHLGFFSHESAIDTAEALHRTLLAHTLTDGMRQASSLSSTSSSTRGGLPDKVDPKQQICFDFTKGACSRGEACKYSHDIALIVSINSQERGICFDHLKGQCNRGLLCRFSHDLSSIAMQQKQFGTKTARRNAPICYDFVKGQCLRGISCRYSHDLSSIIQGNKTETEVCHDFLRGRCHRGGLCRYSHAPPSKVSQIPGGLAAQLAATLLQQAALHPHVEPANLQMLQQLVAQVGAQQAAIALATAAQQHSHVPLANAAGLNMDWNTRMYAAQQQRYQQIVSAMQRMSMQEQQAKMVEAQQQVQHVQQQGLQQVQQQQQQQQQGGGMKEHAVGHPHLQHTTSGGDDFRIQAAFLNNGVLMPTALNAPNPPTMAPGGALPPGVETDSKQGQGPPQPVQAENVEPPIPSWDTLPSKDPPGAASPPGGGSAVHPQSSDMLYRFKEIWER